ncbi:MAG: rRNA pseudouridine synthase [Tissierellia bacterium]|nr:rRNA pseudouridine synthase [Tissierellia bacterium]
MRLQKYIAKSGVTSRRKAEELILQGRVKVNGHVIKELGRIVDPESDVIMVDDEIISLESKKVYIMLNKPSGYVTTLKDRHSDKIVLDLVKEIDERIYPVGRLDKDTTGLLLMTNDGDLAYKLTHPSHIVWKEYVAVVEGHPTNKKIQDLKNGVIIDGRKTSPAFVEIIKKDKTSTVLKIKIHEGRNRQIRKMCQSIRHPVIKLKRIAIGNIKLGNLPLGKWRYLTEKEVEYLKKI